jgi:mono/diheme cytochrome c family protein
MSTWVHAATVILAGTIAPVIGQSAEDKPLFTARQAAQGRAIYAAKCAPCHGEKLQGGSAGPLAGPVFADNWAAGSGSRAWAGSQLTVEDLDFIIRSTMPKGAAVQMSDEEHTAVLAYVLQQNGYKAGATPMRARSSQMKQAPLRFGIAKEMAPVPAPLLVAGDTGAVPKSSAGPGQSELNGATESTRDWLYYTRLFGRALRGARRHQPAERGPTPARLRISGRRRKQLPDWPDCVSRDDVHHRGEGYGGARCDELSAEVAPCVGAARPRGLADEPGRRDEGRISGERDFGWIFVGAECGNGSHGVGSKGSRRQARRDIHDGAPGV